MTLMTDPTITARGILTLLSETVPETELELARSTLDYGYPRLAVIAGLSAAHEEQAPVSEGLRALILREFDWSQDELEAVMSELNQIPLQAA